MATSTCGLPSSSQQSTSDLSEPPDFTEEEITSFSATMAPRTRSRSQSEPKDEVSGNGPTETNGDSTPTHKQTATNGSTVKDDMKDEIVAEIAVATRSSRRRVPSKRAQVTFLEPETPATKRPKTSVKKWTPEHVTQSKQSPLVNKDLRVSYLCQKTERTSFLTCETRRYSYTLRRGMSSATRTRRRYSTFFLTQGTS